MAFWLKTDGTSEQVKPRNGKNFSLEELYNMTNGGPIEIVRVGSLQTVPGEDIIVLNEEGKVRRLPINHKATAYYGNPYDFVVGDALLCADGEVQ